MSVLVTTTVPLSSEVYDQIAAGVRSLLLAAQGFRSHCAYPGESGFVVEEIWDSESDHQSFFSANVAPNLPPGAAVTSKPLRNTILAAAH